MINYSVINHATQYYKGCGFVEVDTQWIVPDYIHSITNPKTDVGFRIKDTDNALVASGEQSFLYEYYKNDTFLKGKYQTTTPCFRYDFVDELHCQQFMKTELIQTDVVTDDELDKMIDMALGFFKQYFPESGLATRFCKKSNSMDIEYRGCELGSYGIRHCKFLSWIYGTGVAEPRLSMILKKYGLS